MPTVQTELSHKDHLRRRSVQTSVRELRSIGTLCAGLVGDGLSSVEHGDVLYDEYGLPK